MRTKKKYIQDYLQVILYHKTSEYKGGGISIVPPLVLSHKFNDRYILFDYLETGKSIDAFVRDFDTVSKDQVVRLLSLTHLKKGNYM